MQKSHLITEIIRFVYNLSIFRNWSCSSNHSFCCESVALTNHRCAVIFGVLKLPINDTVCIIVNKLNIILHFWIRFRCYISNINSCSDFIKSQSFFICCYCCYLFSQEPRIPKNKKQKIKITKQTKNNKSFCVVFFVTNMLLLMPDSSQHMSACKGWYCHMVVFHHHRSH